MHFITIGMLNVMLIRPVGDICNAICYLMLTYSGLYLVCISALMIFWYFFNFSLLRSMHIKTIYYILPQTFYYLPVYNCLMRLLFKVMGGGGLFF